jgi:hypothetical protein
MIFLFRFLAPQTQREDETATQFANRVKELICKKAGLISVPWDGYLKYAMAYYHVFPGVFSSCCLLFPCSRSLRHIRPSERFLHLRQKSFARSIVSRGSSNNLASLGSAMNLSGMVGTPHESPSPPVASSPPPGLLANQAATAQQQQLQHSSLLAGMHT